METTTPSNKRKRQAPGTERSYIDLGSSFSEEDLPDLDESWTLEEEDDKESRKRKTKKNKTVKSSGNPGRKSPAAGSSSAPPLLPWPQKVKNTAIISKPPAEGARSTKTGKDQNAGRKGIANGQKKEKGNDRLVSDALECIICLDFAVSPIHNCLNGHITCGLCVSKLTDKHCAMCKAKLTRSVFGERLAKQLEVKLPCDFRENGCKELVKSTDMKKHRSSCYYRDLRCMLCPEVIPIQKVAAHLELQHNCNSTAKVKQQHRSYQICVPVENLAPSKVPMAAIILYKDKSFVVQFYGTGTSFVSWASLLGSDAEAEKFRYKLTASSVKPSLKKVSLSWSLPVFPAHCGFGFKKPSPLFASIPISTLKTFSSDSDSSGGQAECHLDFEIVKSC